MAAIVKIGRKSLLFSRSLLIRDDETVELDVPLEENAQIGQVPLRLQIGFVPSEKEGQTSITWATHADGAVKFTLSGFKNSSWTGPIEPIDFGGFSNVDRLWFEFIMIVVSPRVSLFQIQLSRGQ